MFQTEKHLYEWLKDHVAGHWQRIETSTGQGIPDTNYCIGGVEGWAELKVLTRKIKPDPESPAIIKPGLRPSQKAWMVRRHRAGGNVCLVIGLWWGELLVIPGKWIHLVELTMSWFALRRLGEIASTDMGGIMAVKNNLQNRQNNS